MPQKILQVAKTTAAAVAKRMVRARPRAHACDPSGFYCECARRRDYQQKQGWFGRSTTRGWLRRSPRDANTW